jgi:phosphoglycolate phosphatase
MTDMAIGEVPRSLQITLRAMARALVFDLDGTLVDSLDDIAHHLNAALAERGLPTRSRAEISQWVGRGSAYLVEHAASDPALAPDVLAAYRAHYQAQPVIHTRVYPGIPDALDALAPHHALAILSNKPHAETVAIAAALLSRWPFAVVVGERPGIPRKPDAQSLLSVLSDLAVSPADAVMIGDTEIDIATARAASTRIVAVTWGFRDATTLAAAGPDRLVTSPVALASQLAG